MKSLLRSHFFQRRAAAVLGWYLWLVMRTNRWSLEGDGNLLPDGKAGPAVFGFWHEFLPAMPVLVMLARRMREYRSVPIYSLVSHHRDGRQIGEVLHRFNIGTVYGSTSRDGAAGMRRLLTLLGNGAVIGITPDGPRGPRRTLAPGVAQLAAAAGVPVVPCAASTSRRIVLRSWDRMALPLPFGRGVIVCGAPIRVPRNGWKEALSEIASGLNQAAERAERLIAAGA